jgi:hypothetical protein
MVVVFVFEFIGSLSHRATHLRMDVLEFGSLGSLAVVIFEHMFFTTFLV